MNRILVVIPVFNEEGSLAPILGGLAGHKHWDCIVVDDDSTDDSVLCAERCGTKILPLRINLGAWGAIQAGMRYAHRNGYKYVVTMDGDGQHLVSEISTLITTLEANHDLDVVIGACPDRGSTLRKWTRSFFKKITGVGIEDITSGFRIYNSRAMDCLVRSEGTLLDYQDVGVILLLQSFGLQVAEVRVKMEERIEGKSHIYYSWLAVLYYMLTTTILSLAKRKSFRIRHIDRQI